MNQGDTYHANFLLGHDREATILLPRDLTPAEAEKIATVVRGLAERSSHASHPAAA
ncbi:MAG: hypothetical protein M1522_05305 [Actinobacteria bacterium]|nr:hypothetical protein [Actinomycetota bacterium]